MTRTTKTTTRKPTYVTNTNAKGTKTGVSNNSRGTKTTVVKNAAGTTYTKVTNAAGKTFTKATDSKGNVIKPKVTAKVVVKATPKVTPKVTATKVAVPKVKTATAVPTDKFQGTSGKSYVIWGGKKGRTEMYGTQAQQDSTYAADNLWNDISRNNKVVNVSGSPTRQGYLKDPSKFKAFTKKQIAELPEYKAPGNTGAGALLKKSSDPKAAGYGTCQAGFRLDSQGNCVRIRGYVPQ